MSVLSELEFSFKEIATAFMVLFAVIDIIGNIPIIIDLRKKVGHIQSEKAALIAGVIMIVFLFVGKSILNLIGIDVNSFAVAGAFPLIAGPGSLTTLLSLRAEFATENIIVAILANMIFLYVVLKTSSKIEKLIGPNGISIVRKVFGVILLAIAVKLFAVNFKLLLA